MPKKAIGEKSYYIPILKHASEGNNKWYTSVEFRKKLTEDVKLYLPAEEKTKLLSGNAIGNKGNYYEWALANLNRFGFLEKKESEDTYRITDLGRSLLKFASTTTLEIDKGILERFASGRKN